MVQRLSPDKILANAKKNRLLPQRWTKIKRPSLPGTGENCTSKRQNRRRCEEGKSLKRGSDRKRSSISIRRQQTNARETLHLLQRTYKMQIRINLYSNCKSCSTLQANPHHPPGCLVLLALLFSVGLCSVWRASGRDCQVLLR